MAVVKLTAENFEQEVLKSDKPVLVDFYADWCGPCRMLGPVLEELSNEYNIYKVNVDNEEELARKYGIMSIPCVISFKDGNEHKRSVGLVDKETLLELLK